MAYTRVNQGELAVGGVTFGLNSIENSTAGYVLTSTGTDTNIPSWQDVSASGAVTQLEADDATIALPSAGIVTISGGATGLTTTTSGSDLSLTGVLNVAYGGTGAASLNEYELLVGNGTGAIQVIGNVSSSGIPLISKGFAAVPAYGTCTVPGGGTDKTSFTEYALVAGGTSTTGALQQVSISGASAGEVLTYVSSSALPTWQANAALQTIDGDSGSATGTTITLTALASSVNCGASVDFSATGSTVTLNVTDSSNNTFIGKGTGTASATGSSNTGLGYQSILASTGDIANTAVGYKTLSTLNGGSANTVMGGSSGLNLATGGYNTLLGYSVGANYTGSESSNIVIGALNAGSSAESHALRIGNGTGTGLGNLNAAYIQGIYNNNSSGFTDPLPVFIDSTTGQLGYGTAVNPASSCAFSAELSTTQNSFFTDGAFVTLKFDTKIFDLGTNYSTSTNTFTAPATGYYMFTAAAGLGGLTDSTLTEYSMQLVTTGGTYLFCNGNPYSQSDPVGNTLAVNQATFVPMTSGDTAIVQITLHNAGSTGNANLLGANFGIGQFRTVFSGYRVA